MKAGVQNWLAERSPRERYLLLGAAVLAMIWLSFTVVWQPLVAHEAALTDRIMRYERSLAVLNVSPQASTAVTSDPRPVPVILAGTAAEFGLTIRRLEPEGSGARLVLEEASFNDVILWLERMEQDHGLRLTDLEMTRRPAPGVVTATLALQK